MNLNFWKDDLWNDLLIDRRWYLSNLFTMIDNWFFEWKMNKKVINIIKKSDEELSEMWFTKDDISKIRIKTSMKNLKKNWFDIKELCIFEISKNRKKFVIKIMDLLENNKNSEIKEFICNLADYKKIELWLEMPDLDLINWAKKRGEKNTKK